MGQEVVTLIKTVVDRALAPVRNRVLLMIGKCVLAATADSEGVQRVKVSVLAEELFDEIERFQEYGLTSRPPTGAEGVIIFPGGDRTHGVVISLDHRDFRKKDLEEGEVALYSKLGDFVWLRTGRRLNARANKFKFQGESEEMLDLLVRITEEARQIADKLSTTTTNTVFGPMRLNDFAFFLSRKVALTELKAKLDSIRDT